jgi:tetratricopeptide (TPR) repeat protein
MSRRLQLFISSKMEELAPERAAIKSALGELQIDAWVFERDAGARAGNIQQTYLTELDASDLYIGIFWKGYGEYTVEEFEHARNQGKDCLVYEKREEIEGTRDPALQEFLDRIGKVKGAVTIRRFQTAAELPAFLKTDVAGWQADKVRLANLPGTHAPFQAPPQSDRYVERTALHTRLKTAILPATGEEREPLTRAVLHGTGGIGKTSLAIALAHDADLRRAFPHGVLWVSLGRTPDLLQLQSAWGRALEDSQAGNLGYPDLVTGASQLRTLLRNRACLLVVDDAWQGTHVESAFLVGGPRCLLLVTTRLAEVAQKLDAASFELEGMAESEAFALFQRWAGSLPEVDRGTAGWLAAQVDYLPLALELIGAQVGRGGSWSDYRARWDAQRLAALKRGRRASGRDDNIIDSVELSVNALPAEDREAYLQLAVFAPGAAFHASAAAALWNMDVTDAVDLLLDLAGQALLSRSRDGAHPWFGLHALLHQYVVSAHASTGLAPLHQTLIGGYRKRFPAGWTDGVDDGYLFDNLSYHLAAAGDTRGLFALVDTRWMQAQFARTESHRQFAADVERALQAAAAEQPRDWPMMVRCRRFVSRLYAQAEQLSENELETLARMGRTARVLGALPLVPGLTIRSKLYRRLGEILLESGDREHAADAFRSAAEALNDTLEYPSIGAEYLAAAAEGLHRCGCAAEAASALARADALLATEPLLINRASPWKALARARAAIEGVPAALDNAAGWLREVESAPGDDRTYGISALARVFAEVRHVESLKRLSVVALRLRQQGRDDWGLSETVIALAECGETVQARELLPKISYPSYFLKASAACARASLAAGDRATVERILTQLCDSVRQCAEKGQGINLEEFGPLRQILLDAEGKAGFDRLAAAVLPYRDPVWRAFALSQLALAAAAVGEEAQMRNHSDEAVRVLAEALKKGPLHGEAIRLDTALSLLDAGSLDHAVRIIDDISEEMHRKALCDLALRLFARGEKKRAEAFLDKALAETSAEIRDDAEVSAMAAAARSLASSNIASARQLVEIAARLIPRIAYDSTRASAHASVAQAWNNLGEHEKAREALREALAGLDVDYGWDPAVACRCYELAVTLDDNAAVENTLGRLNDNWNRKTAVVAGVVKALLAQGAATRARTFFDEVRSGEREFVPWNEVPKAESLAELVRMDDPPVLEWLEDGAGLHDPALRAGLLGQVAAAWARLGRLDRAQTAVASALDAASGLSDEIRSQTANRFSGELASAGALALAGTVIESLPGEFQQDSARRAVALAAVTARQYNEARAVAGAIRNSWQREQVLTEVAEQIAEAGDRETALACARQSGADNLLPYIYATLAHTHARASRPAEARSLLKEEREPDDDTTYLAALAHARRAQVQAIIGDTADAVRSASAAMETAESATWPFVTAWCAEAFACSGEIGRAAQAAERTLENVKDTNDEWVRSRHLEVAAGALAFARTLDKETILAIVREMANEFARADALGRLYPHLGPDATESSIAEFQNDWAKAEALAVVADSMEKAGAGAEISRLLKTAQAMENKWAGAYALGRIASALAGGGDPDDLTGALKSLAGYELPGWRRAAAVAMAARALRRIGSLDRAVDLAHDAWSVVRQQEDWDLKARTLHAVQCALAALQLGDRAEAEVLAGVAQSAALRISSARYARHDLIEPLCDLAGELRDPQGFERALQLWRDGDAPRIRILSASDVAVRLARLGHHDAALDKLNVALAEIAALDSNDAAQLHADAAAVLYLCGDPAGAGAHLSAALALPLSRSQLANVLKANIAFLTSLDGGQTLARVFPISDPE